MNNPYRIILSPIVTEKSTSLRGEENKHSFFVMKTANKSEIKKAIESLFKIKVIKVNTLRLKGKKKRLGIHEGYRQDRKKAVVTLKGGDTINIFEGA